MIQQVKDIETSFMQIRVAPIKLLISGRSFFSIH